MPAPTITCPHCGEPFDPLAVARGEDLAEYLAVLAEFGEHRAIVRDYIGLFRKSPKSVMRVSTRLKVAREVLRLWRTMRFCYNGRDYQVDRPAIAAALHQTVQRLGATAGLSNHNYLKKILLGPARQAEAARERQVEASRRRGDHRKRREAPAQRLGSQGGPGGGQSAAAGDRRRPARPGSGGSPDEPPERPIWEGPPEQVTAALALAYKRPIMLTAMPETVRRLEAAVARAGADLERLRALAKRLPDDVDQEPGLGRRLLEQCRRTEGDDGPTPVGECLPSLGQVKGDRSG